MSCLRRPLLSPYNWVGPDVTSECARKSGSTCLEPAPYAFWRHTFAEVGVFDYRDSGGSLVQSGSTYSYGLPPGGTTTKSAATGTVCVRSSPHRQRVRTGLVAVRTATAPKESPALGGRCGE